MTMTRRMIAGAAGLAALGVAAPAAAQYAYPYGYSPYSQYGYGSPYGHNMSQMAVQQCTAAVQARLNNRTSSGGVGGILGAILGVNSNTYAQGRVLSITQVDPDRTKIQVRGLATSGRMAYNPYGYGYYGSSAYAFQPDLRFECDVDYRGYVRDVDINRR